MAEFTAEQRERLERIRGSLRERVRTLNLDGPYVKLKPEPLSTAGITLHWDDGGQFDQTRKQGKAEMREDLIGQGAREYREMVDVEARKLGI